MDSIYSINIERSVLSSILFDQEIIEDILGILKPKDYYYPAHQKIFEVMEQLNAKDLPIDEEFLKKSIKNFNIDDSVLLDILSSNPISNIMAYVKEIKDAAIKRELSHLAHVIQKEVENNESTAIASIDTVQNALYKISTDSASTDLKDMQTINLETLEHIKAMKERGDSYLIGETTGFVALDKKTTGFNNGDLVIIAARPAMGKTALVLNTALKNIEQNKGVVIFSLEMPSSQLMLRLLSIKTQIPLQDLRKGSLTDKQWSLLSGAVDNLNTKKLWVDDNGSLNINQLRARVRKLAQNKENNISMIIIDYLQLMQGTGTKDRHQEVSEISRGLKMLAREINIPIIALSQLNRGLESRPDKRPMLSDIRESGSIEQDADIIIFVYRDDVYKERDELRKEKESKDKGEKYVSKFVSKNEEDTELIIGKQRNGPIGTVKLVFQKNLTKFLEKDYGAPIEEIYSSQDSERETKVDQYDMPNI